MHSLNYKEVADVRIGKYMELTIEKSERDINEVVEEICLNILANPVIEDYRYEVEECVTQ
jgi:phosphoribosylformylglycinamidine synthase